MDQKPDGSVNYQTCDANELHNKCWMGECDKCQNGNVYLYHTDLDAKNSQQACFPICYEAERSSCTPQMSLTQTLQTKVGDWVNVQYDGREYPGLW